MFRVWGLWKIEGLGFRENLGFRVSGNAGLRV